MRINVYSLCELVVLFLLFLFGFFVSNAEVSEASWWSSSGLFDFLARELRMGPRHLGWPGWCRDFDNILFLLVDRFAFFLRRWRIGMFLLIVGFDPADLLCKNVV